MYRLAIIAVDSGACIANPVYRDRTTAEAECSAFLQFCADDFYLNYYSFVCEETGNDYRISNQSDIAFVIEEVPESDYKTQLNG